MIQVCDSYSESNQSGQYNPLGVWDVMGTYPYQGQSFTGNGGVLNSCKFYLKKNSSASGNCYAKVYAHTGTFGTDGVPTGDALATSDIINVSTLSTSFGLVEFVFNGINKINLINEMKYCIVVNFEGNSVIFMGIDNTSPSHGGNFIMYWTEWGSDDRYDACFYVYTGEETISPFPSFKRP